MTGYSKTEHAFLRIRSTCFFDDTNLEAFQVRLDSGTNEPGTSWSSLKSAIKWNSRLVRTPTMRSHQGAPIDLVQLATIYQTGPGHIRYYDFDKEIQRVARLHLTNEAYLNFFLSKTPLI